MQLVAIHSSEHTSDQEFSGIIRSYAACGSASPAVHPHLFFLSFFLSFLQRLANLTVDLLAQP